MKHIQSTIVLISLLTFQHLYCSDADRPDISKASIAGFRVKENDTVLKHAADVFDLAAEVVGRLQDIRDDLEADILRSPIQRHAIQAELIATEQKLATAKIQEERAKQSVEILESALQDADLEKRRNAQEMSLLFAGLDWKTIKEFRGSSKTPAQIRAQCYTDSVKIVQPRSVKQIIATYMIKKQLAINAASGIKSIPVFKPKTIQARPIIIVSEPRKLLPEVKIATKPKKPKAPTRITSDDEDDFEKDVEFKSARHFKPTTFGETGMSAARNLFND